MNTSHPSTNSAHGNHSNLSALLQEANKLSAEIKQTHLKQILQKEIMPLVEAEDILLDISRSKLTPSILKVLINILASSGFIEKRKAMFSGEKINSTENRAVLHTALRCNSSTPVPQPSKEITADIEKTRNNMIQFCNSVHSGEVKAYGGKEFTHIVSIGIGGSYLGTRMAYQALQGHDAKKEKTLLFLSNVDGDATHKVLSEIPLETTLFAIASKTFTTEETMQNANTARERVINVLGEKSIAHNFIALSSNLEAVSNFGITAERTFGFWDFVGGRFSVWSSVGMPLALALGGNVFSRFLNGAQSMDAHFYNAPPEKNLPVLMALTHFFWNTMLSHSSRVVVPYCEALSALPLFLQQLEMESNGKSTNCNGERITNSSNHVWGETGTNAQHSFFQLLHQGVSIVGVDFIGFAKPTHPQLNIHHKKLSAHMLAQMEAMALGKELKDDSQLTAIEKHKKFDGDRPSLLLMPKQLTPESLGKIVALYEHKVFCQGVLWNINSFDQWGVELGKSVAKTIYAAINNGNSSDGLHPATARLLKKLG